MIICNAAQTAARLPYGPLVEAVADVLRAKVAGTATAPERLAVGLSAPGVHGGVQGNVQGSANGSVPGGVLLCMPAADESIAVTKLITVHPGNRSLGLPVIQGEMTVLAADTGRRLLLLDGATVTARRTAAVSVLAIRQLAIHQQRPQGPLLLVGAGVQAAAHLEACREVLGVERVFLHSRSVSSAQALAQRARELGMAVEVVHKDTEVVADAGPSLSEALEACPLIITATTSPTPVLPDAVRPDVCIVALGSFHADQAELPASLMRRARVVVDAPEAARHEAGDILLAGLDWATVESLETLLDAPSPDAGRPTVFKSVGCAYFDLAAGRVAAGDAGELPVI